MEWSARISYHPPLGEGEEGEGGHLVGGKGGEREGREGGGTEEEEEEKGKWQRIKIVPTSYMYMYM